MFQFPGLPSCTYGFSTEYPDMTPDGFPHSGIHGSSPACGYPWRFAAGRALLRLLAPRHPPYALSILTLQVSLESSYFASPAASCAVVKEQIFRVSKLYIKLIFGGGKRSRTADPLLARQVLSQLSYTPKPFSLLLYSGGPGWT